MDDASPDERQRVPDARPRLTLGQRLDARARERTAALVPHLTWARPFVVLAHRVEQLAEVSGERFERVEQHPPTDGPTRDLLSPGRMTTHPTGRGPAVPGGSAPAAPPTAAAQESAGLMLGPPGGGGGRRQGGTELREVPSSVRSRLRRLVGPAADAMRVHTGPVADAAARAADADAITVGRDVHVRQGRYAPQREEGVALLVHEATHVATALDPGRAWRRAVGADAGAEERIARDQERRVLGGAVAGPSGRVARSGTVPGDDTRPAFGPHAGSGLAVDRTSAALAGVAPAGVAAGLPPAGPRAAGPQAAGTQAAGTQAARAATDRDLSGSPAPDLESLRRGLVAEVMRQITSEFERGG